MSSTDRPCGVHFPSVFIAETVPLRYCLCLVFEVSRVSRLSRYPRGETARHFETVDCSDEPFFCDRSEVEVVDQVVDLW